MNKRDIVLGLVEGNAPQGYTPAAFFLHFDPVYHAGQAAIEKHLEFFRYTDMDFVKIQYEQRQPPGPPVRTAADWANLPLYPPDFFAAPAEVVGGLVKAAQKEALVILTLYSPLMWAVRAVGDADIKAHLQENPAAVAKGLEIMTENVLNLVRACKRVGVDGFYASSQGGEAFRFPGTDYFARYIKPTDLAVWSELDACTFNILHVCDYVGSYDDLTPFLDYPGDVVNASLEVGGKQITAAEAAQLFGRPFMGGMERKGVIATGAPAVIRQAAADVLAQAPARFILGADCTVPAETPWANLREVIAVAHGK